MVHVAAVGFGENKRNQQCFVVVQTKERPNRSVWEDSLVPGISTRLGQRGIDIAGIIVWNRPMPLDPRHNSKIVYKQLAVNMISAVETIRNFEYNSKPAGFAQIFSERNHSGLLFGPSAVIDEGGGSGSGAKSADVEAKVDTVPLIK